MQRSVRWAIASAATYGWLVVLALPALAHENQVIRFGSFLGGFTHPVLGLDHFLAMVSVGIVSALIGGRAIWTIPALFVVAMALGGAVGRVDIGVGMGVVETGIALSVVFLGLVIALDRRLPVAAVMATVLFFGLFHGYAHGVEIPEVARPGTYAAGFLSGTALIHLLGVLIGEVAKRYAAGRTVLRIVGAGFGVVGGLFLLGLI